MLGIPLLGVVPESKNVLTASNMGLPVIASNQTDKAAIAYDDAVARLLGEEREMQFLTPDTPVRRISPILMIFKSLHRIFFVAYLEQVDFIEVDK